MNNLHRRALLIYLMRPASPQLPRRRLNERLMEGRSHAGVLISSSEGFLMCLQGERGEGRGRDHIRGTTQEEEAWRRKDRPIGKRFLLAPVVFLRCDGCMNKE